MPLGSPDRVKVSPFPPAQGVNHGAALLGFKWQMIVLNLKSPFPTIFHRSKRQIGIKGSDFSGTKGYFSPFQSILVDRGGQQDSSPLGLNSVPGLSPLCWLKAAPTPAVVAHLPQDLVKQLRLGTHPAVPKVSEETLFHLSGCYSMKAAAGATLFWCSPLSFVIGSVLDVGFCS